MLMPLLRVLAATCRYADADEACRHAAASPMPIAARRRLPVYMLLRIMRLLTRGASAPARYAGADALRAPCAISCSI